MAPDYQKTIFEEIESLKLKAIGKTGFDNFGDPFFEKPLAAWLKDIRNPMLSDFGAQYLRRIAIRDLCRRLSVFRFIADHPEILEVKIPPIILIMAIPRTGTTGQAVSSVSCWRSVSACLRRGAPAPLRAGAGWAGFSRGTCLSGANR